MQVLDRAEEGTTRRRIMDAALELFAQHGYAGASMRMLARAAGLTLIRREHFTTSTEMPPRPQVDAAVARFIDNFIGTVLR